ncbi:MAG: thioredoxin domain-containing protein [Burkholderiales bacterium]
MAKAGTGGSDRGQGVQARCGDHGRAEKAEGAGASLIAGSLIVVFVPIFGALVYHSEKSTTSAPTPAAERAAVPPERKGELVRMHSPALGRHDAPVVIVEFFDSACGTCRDFYPFVKQMMAANPDRIRLVLRYAAFHEGSDRVVAALEAARRQGQFWPALEAVLRAQGDWVINHTAQVDRAWKHLEPLGLDLGQLRSDMDSAAVAALIRQDLEDTVALGVSQTPEFFVNGKPLPRFGYDELAQAVKGALAAAR